ncbi:hypothetical protein Tco_0940781 [Tanacetum coccineum]|uniref:Uncharacterized protein n=1 Tax=Tanacetum coccineum TaxID=301880 RepID=A0ABQ5DNY8_9ASTR
MFTRSVVIQRRVEDLQLGVESYQKKLNLTKPDTYRPDLKRREAYTAYSNPKGFNYQNKDKNNRLMRIDKLHKFSDGTLNDVWTALNDRLKGIRMQYLPHTIWRQSDKDKAAQTKLKPIQALVAKWRHLVHALTNHGLYMYFGRFISGYWFEPRFYTLSGNHVKEILLKLNLLDHRILKDGGEVEWKSLNSDGPGSGAPFMRGDAGRGGSGRLTRVLVELSLMRSLTTHDKILGDLGEFVGLLVSVKAVGFHSFNRISRALLRIFIATLALALMHEDL